MTVLLTLYRVCLLSLVVSNSLAAKAYTEMNLKPVHIKNNEFKQMQLGRTYNYYDGSRILAAKEAIFPILEQYETLLFPQKDFKKEKPKARLERIEIAVHGNIQNGSIKHRLNLLENEITAWQIANYQTLQILDTKQKDSNAFAYAQNQAQEKRTSIRRSSNPYQIPAYPSQRAHISQKKAVDYDYQNYRTASPIIRDIGRRSIRAIFEH
jgi:hypothetical protein